MRIVKCQTGLIYEQNIEYWLEHMIPSMEIEALKSRVDTIVEYYGDDDAVVVEQANKVKKEIDNLAEKMERESGNQ